MGLLDSIGKGKSRTAGTPPAAAPARATASGSGPSTPARATGARSTGVKPATPASKKRGKRGGAPSARERVATVAAPLHERRRRLVSARESTLRDLGGLMLEMYKRNRFREELLLDKCEEVLAIEVEVAHVDQRLFQLAPPNAAGMRPIGRCECGAPIHPGQNFCGVCGRSFTTLTQARACTKCGSGLRGGDQFCATCGNEAPDMLQSIESPGPGAGSVIAPMNASAVAASAVADTVIIDAPPPLDEAPVAAMPVATTAPTMPAPSGKPTPSGAPAGRGFDWSAPPVIPDAAIDTALDVAAAQRAPFAGIPLGATLPPPPFTDGGDVTLITPAAAGASPLPFVQTTAGAAVSNMPPPGVPPAPSVSPKQAAKAEAAHKRARIKEAKARAKVARATRKRGDGS